MKHIVHKVLKVSAPVFAVFIAIALLQEAQIGFPIELSFNAWPKWLILMALVYAANSFLQFWIDRLLGSGDCSISNHAWQEINKHFGKVDSIR